MVHTVQDSSGESERGRGVAGAALVIKEGWRGVYMTGCVYQVLVGDKFIRGCEFGLVAELLSSVAFSCYSRRRISFRFACKDVLQVGHS